MEFTVPGIDERPALSITCVKPVHPCDEIAIKLEPDTIEQVVHFIRSHGIDQEDLIQRRAYATAEEKGVWKNGSAGFIQKLPCKSDDEEEEYPRRRKYKAIKAEADENAQLSAITCAPLEEPTPLQDCAHES